VAIDQYAEKAFANRSYFLNKPYGNGGGKRGGRPPELLSTEIVNRRVGLPFKNNYEKTRVFICLVWSFAGAVV
jgi:hypothetical protein